MLKSPILATTWTAPDGVMRTSAPSWLRIDAGWPLRRRGGVQVTIPYSVPLGAKETASSPVAWLPAGWPECGAAPIDMRPVTTSLSDPAAAVAGCGIRATPAVAPMHESPISGLLKHFPAGCECRPPLPASATTSAPVGENVSWRGFG